MNGWEPFDAVDWPESAEFLTATGKPWPLGMVKYDLRWHLSQKGRVPGRPTLRKRWNWKDWDVRQLLADEASWQDPLKPRHQKPSSPPPARLQRSSSDPPAAERTNLNNPPDSSSDPPAILQESSSPPPASLHTRGDHRHRSPTPVTPDREGVLSSDSEADPPSAHPPSPWTRLSEPWQIVWREAHGVECLLDAARHTEPLRQLREACDGDLALATAAVRCFLTLSGVGQASWSKRPAATLTPVELVADLAKWVSAGRVAKVQLEAAFQQEADRREPVEQPHPKRLELVPDTKPADDLPERLERLADTLRDAQSPVANPEPTIRDSRGLEEPLRTRVFQFATRLRSIARFERCAHELRQGQIDARGRRDLEQALADHAWWMEAERAEVDACP